MHFDVCVCVRVQVCLVVSLTCGTVHSTNNALLAYTRFVISHECQCEFVF